MSTRHIEKEQSFLGYACAFTIVVASPRQDHIAHDHSYSDFLQHLSSQNRHILFCSHPRISTTVVLVEKGMQMMFALISLQDWRAVPPGSPDRFAQSNPTVNLAHHDYAGWLPVRTIQFSGFPKAANGKAAIMCKASTKRPKEMPFFYSTIYSACEIMTVH